MCGVLAVKGALIHGFLDNQYSLWCIAYQEGTVVVKHEIHFTLIPGLYLYHFKGKQNGCLSFLVDGEE